jgi:hypothetical protein
MGRWDALTKLEQPKKPIKQPVVSPPSKAQLPVKAVTQPHEEKKPTKPQNHLSTIQFSTLDTSEKVEKYTTHLEPSLIKKIKLYAVEKEIKDYEVVKDALLFYFEKNK